MDQEIRQRAEAVRSRKKMEADFNDLEISLATAQRHADESQKTTKNLTLSIKDLHVKLEDITRATEDAKEQVKLPFVVKMVLSGKFQGTVAERRVGLMNTEIEELRGALEQGERARKQAEHDLMEANERSNMLHTQNTAFINQKRKIENELNNVRTEVDEAIAEARQAEEAAKKALTTAALLAEDLKKEQDQSSHLERMKKNQENSVKDLQMRLDEAEQVKLKLLFKTDTLNLGGSERRQEACSKTGGSNA